MSEELPPEDLLARVARQDEAALGELYDRYAPRVYGLIAYALPSRDTAEEILRDVFMRLWNESSSLSQEGGSVVAWLVVTAREAAVDRLRVSRKNATCPGKHIPSANPGRGSDTVPRKFKVPALPTPKAKVLERNDDALKPRPADGKTTPATQHFSAAGLPHPKEIALIDDRLALLHKAIEELPKPQRDALELAVFGGLSESEIAVAMGEPLAKAQRSLRAAVTFVKHRRRAVCGTWAANI
jgi:RNA polymerase sigma-70 factor (ECF subfamily)